MSKKTIAFQIPQKAPGGPAERKLASVPAQAVIEAEHWVSRIEPPVETLREPIRETAAAAPRAATITFAISAEPDLFEVARIGLFLPATAFWLWGLAATQKSFKLFAR